MDPTAPLLDLRQPARARGLVIDPPGDLGAAVIATWRGRMVNEHRSSAVFAGIAAQFAALGDLVRAAACRGFADEERRHGVLCGAVVEAAGGDAAAPCPPSRAVPQHRDTTPRAAVVRNVLSTCCLSETVAVALIGAEREEMPDGPLRALLSQILADEIGHARFGWGFVADALPTLSSDERDAVARYVPVALTALIEHELDHLPANRWPADGARFGLCDGADARALLFDTITTVIAPQLAALGLPCPTPAPGAMS